MTQLGGRQWTQVWTAVSSALVSAGPGEQHLATEAVVAYVDGELSLAADQRATRHLAACAMCTAEVAAQRQARTAVRSATAPTMPPSLLAALHAIPQSADLPPGPDQLSIDENGEFVVAQRPLAEVARGPLGDTPPLGLSAPLGSADRIGSSTPLGVGGVTGLEQPASRRVSRRARNGAGVVATGLVLGALAFAAPSEPAMPGVPRPGAETGSQPVTAVPARFEVTRRLPGEAEPSLVAPGLAQR